MPLYAGELNLRRGAPLSEFPAPMSEVLRAQAEETRARNPLQSVFSLQEIEAAQQGEITDPGDMRLGIPATRGPVQMLDAETARARIKEEALPITVPDEGISSRYLDILIRQKRAEVQRQSIFARGSGGVGEGAARLGVTFVESLFDPLNIASAFVPVVGPARYAGMVAGTASALGRAGVRFGVGAAEGAVGAALLEPLIYSAARAEQADYDMTDSLLNIGFGGLFGGGLHAGGGALRDVVQPGWWRMAQPTADSPALGDSTMRLPGVPDAPPAPREPVRSPDARDAIDIATRIVEAEQKPGFQRTAEDLLALKETRTPEIERAVESLSKPGFERTAEDVIYLRALEKGHEGDYINERIGTTLRQMDDIDRQMLARGNSPESEGAVVQKRALTEQLERDTQRLTELGRRINEAALVMERVSPETRQAALRASVAQAVEGRVNTVDALVQMDPTMRTRTGQTAAQAITDARAAAQRTPVMSAEPTASTAARSTADSPTRSTDLRTAEDELQRTLDELDAYKQFLPDEGGKGVDAQLRPFAEAVRRADDYAKALRAGAACGVA